MESYLGNKRKKERKKEEKKNLSVCRLCNINLSQVYGWTGKIYRLKIVWLSLPIYLPTYLSIYLYILISLISQLKYTEKNPQNNNNQSSITILLSLMNN